MKPSITWHCVACYVSLPYAHTSLLALARKKKRWEMLHNLVGKRIFAWKMVFHSLWGDAITSGKTAHNDCRRGPDDHQLALVHAAYTTQQGENVSKTWIWCKADGRELINDCWKKMFQRSRGLIMRLWFFSHLSFIFISSQFEVLGECTEKNDNHSNSNGRRSLWIWKKR